MRRLRYSVRRDEHGRTVWVRGRLDQRTRGRLQDLVLDLSVGESTPIVIDLTDLEYFDSASLEVLLGAQRLVELTSDCPVEVRGLEDATWRLAWKDQPNDVR